MSRTITLDIPEPLFDLVANAAGESGRTPADWIVDRIAVQLEETPSIRDASIPVDPDRKRSLEAEDRLRQMFGSFDSGDPHSCDNERIDADLAREYANELDEED